MCAVEGSQWDVWIHELSRGTRTRLTFNGDANDAVWTPDGTALIYYDGNSSTDFALKRRSADGTDEPDDVLSSIYLGTAEQVLTVAAIGTEGLIGYSFNGVLAGYMPFQDSIGDAHSFEQLRFVDYGARAVAFGDDGVVATAQGSQEWAGGCL